MVITVLVVVVGVVLVALLALDRPRHLVRRPVRRPGVALAAVLATVVADVVHLPGGPTARLVAAALALWALLANVHLRGAALAAAGVALGALPVLLNGAVTVPERVAFQLGHSGLPGSELGPARRVEQPGDHLVALGAAVPSPVGGRALRFADLVVAVGLVDAAAYVATVPRARRRSRVPTRHPSARVATVALATARALDVPRPAGDDGLGSDHVAGGGPDADAPDVVVVVPVGAGTP